MQEYDLSLANGLVDYLRQENARNVTVIGCNMEKYAETFKMNNIHTDIRYHSVMNKLSQQPVEWVISLGEYVSPQSEDSFLEYIHNNNTYGVILSYIIEGKEDLTDLHSVGVCSKMYDLGYIHDIESEHKLRNMSTVACLKHTIMVFRKAYNYTQDNYSLCLMYNKPEHLNSHIMRLPETHDIGCYTTIYRNYFKNCTKDDFMIDIGANMGLSACPILSLGNRVVCFEPEPLNHEMLQYIKKYNKYNHMYIENCAVIGEKGKHKTTFYSNIHREDNSSVNELCCKGNVMPRGVIKKEVNSITLDEWYEANKLQFNLCDLLLLKIDVQGGELDILNGAINVLKSCSVYGKCQVEIECDAGFMRILNISFDTINNVMHKCGFKCILKGYDSIFIPK